MTVVSLPAWRCRCTIFEPTLPQVTATVSRAGLLRRRAGDAGGGSSGKMVTTQGGTLAAHRRYEQTPRRSTPFTVGTRRFEIVELRREQGNIAPPIVRPYSKGGGAMTTCDTVERGQGGAARECWGVVLALVGGGEDRSTRSPTTRRIFLAHWHVLIAGLRQTNGAGADSGCAASAPGMRHTQRSELCGSSRRGGECAAARLAIGDAELGQRAHLS